MNAYVSKLAPPGPRSNGAHRRKMSRLAALAASASLAAIASPAYAQCVEGPPSTFACSGQTDVSQVITADDAKVTTNPGFEVDTSNNGNGIALQVTGAGLISFEGSPDLTGAGARFSTTGGSGLSAGELSIFSNGNILANGANALRLDNSGGGDTTAMWVGSIANIAGNGVFTTSALGAGDLFLFVDDVLARDGGIQAQYNGNGSVTITTDGPVIGHTGAGLRINAGAAADDIDVTVRDVTGGSWGILVDSQGTDIVKVDASGVVTGLSEAGIAVVAGTNATGIDIRATQVDGLVSGIQADNQGIGDTVIAATGPVSSGGNGIFAVNGASARDILIAATDVSGFYGIRSFNEGTGSTSITATGLVDGTDYGIIAQNVGGSTDLNIRAANVSANGNGIEVENFGSGTTSVVVDTVTGLGDVGVRISTANSAGSVDLTVGDVTGGDSGAVISNGGIGAARLTATGTVTGAGNIGINVNNHASATDIEIHANNVNAGSYFGVLGLNQGTGDTLIETTGLVAVADTFGIIGLNEATARNMTVSAVDVIAGRGLSITNSGTGTTDVVSTGTVTGYAFEGVAVGTEGTATDLRVDVNVVNGKSSGMRISNQGIGSTSIRARGTVTAATGNGIDVAIGATAQDVAVDAVDVIGTSGIFVDNDGTGITKVDATGTVTGLDNAGIAINGAATTTGIQVHANAVNGQTLGIQTANFGSGNTIITATGPVAAATDVGIRAYNGFDASHMLITAGDVSGTFGINGNSDGTGSTRINSTGNVVGFVVDGVRIENGATTTSALVDVHNVEGAQFGIQVNNLGTGLSWVRASGAVSGGTHNGIQIKTGAASTSVTVDVVDVTGTSGIAVTNFGVDSTNISATGTVTGTAVDGFGIGVANGTGSTDIRVAAIGVAGGARGIDTNNDGNGETLIETTGPVSGGQSGIFARNGVGATDVTVRASEVQSGGEGIGVENYGSGTTTIIAGTAAGESGAGIRAYAAASASDITVEAGTVSGGFYGVVASNSGTGTTSITATGSVTGGVQGIHVNNGTASTGLTIRAADVTGGGFGITAGNMGSGETTVIATGTVTAGEDVGIYAIGGENTGDAAVLAASVSGSLGGIRVDNLGTGATSIRATGPVSGTEFGILAENDQSTTDLTIRAVDVQAVGNAITAENLGSGETMIVTTGTVTSQDAVGILVFAGGNSGDITVESGNASGGSSGISAINFGLGDTRITVNGVAQGSTNGVEAFSDGNQRVAIVNNGTIRNASGLGSARALSASGGSVGIGNTGALLGTVEIAGDSSLLINAGNWRSTGGISIFATLDDTLFNATTGTLLGGVLAATAESSVWQGLEHFQNSGVLRLQDGGVGDIIQTSAATVFANGSTLTVDIAGATGADSFRTTGAVAIEAGSRLQAVAAQPLVLHGKHVVVQADGGLTGQFAFEDQLLTAFAGLRDGYTATTAFLEFAQLKALASAGLTPNQKAAAAGADSLPDGNPVKDALLLLPTDAAAQAAFDQLSGEIHPSARNAMVEDSRLVRNAVLDRLADGETGGALWGRLFSTSGVSDGDYNAAELDRDTKGGMIGLDRSIGPVTIGVAGGWTDTKLRVGRRDSSGSIEGLHGIVYAGARFGGFGLRGGVGYARTSTETTRRIAFQGFSASPTADYDGSVLQGFVEASYRVPLGSGHVEPFVGLTAIRAKTDAFTEAGGPAALSGAAISEKTMGSTLGARFETNRVGPISLRGTVGWRHGWGDLEPVGRHAFAGGTPFTVLGTAGSGDAGVFNAEARFRLSSSATLSVGYDGVLGSGTADHAITGGLKIVF